MRWALFAYLQIWLINHTLGVVPQITKLNVQCDRAGMKVVVEFDIPFNGIIYSKGHYNDQNCRYVNPRSQRNNYMFFIPSTQCGTISTAARRDGSVGFKNVIIFQNDPEYQEVWDMARKISCDWVTRIDKYVTFAPFGVDMLGIKEVSFPGDTVDCWMDIQRGHGPYAPTIAGVVPIGEQLTIVIYIRDKDRSFDVHVKDCYAYDSPDYKNPNTRVIQLSDARGCAIKEKLVRGFFRTRDVRNSGATIIAYGVINAFKFPERMDVFLACNVEVCKGGCDNPCQPEVATGGQDTVTQEIDQTPVQTPDQTPDQTPEQTPDEKPEQTPDEQNPDRMDVTTAASDEEDDDEADTVSSTAAPDAESTDEDTDGGSDDATGGMLNGSKPEADDEEDSDSGAEPTTTTTTASSASEEDSGETGDNEGDNGSSDSEGSSGTDSDTGSAANGGTDSEDNSSDDEEESASSDSKARLQTNGRKGGKLRAGTKILNSGLKSPSRSAKLKANNIRNARLVADRNPRPVNNRNGKLKSARNAKLENNRNKSLSSRNSNNKKNNKKPTVSTNNEQRTKKSLSITQNNRKNKKQIRNKRSIMITSGNATFADMSHSLTIISPIEDFDDKELELWERAKDDQNKVCVSVIGLISSSLTLIGLFVIISIGFILTYGRLKKYDFKCNY